MEQSVSIRLPDGESICVGSEKRYGKVDFTAPVTIGCGRPHGRVVAVDSPPETTPLLRRSCITQVGHGNLLGELLRQGPDLPLGSILGVTILYGYFPR